MSQLLELSPRALFLQELHTLINKAIEECKKLAEKYPPTDGTKVFLECVEYSLAPLIQKAKENQQLRELLKAFGINLEDLIREGAEQVSQKLPSEEKSGGGSKLSSEEKASLSNLRSLAEHLAKLPLLM